MGRTRLLVSTLAELEKRISQCEKQKKALLNYVNRIKNKCLNNEISYYEYEKLLARKLDGRSVESWLREYDSFITKCKKKIIKIKRGGKRKKVVKVFLSLFVVLAIIFSAFYFRPVLVGFLVQEQVEQYVDQVDLEFFESQDYGLILENTGELKSLMVSGEIIGEGGVRIYLDDYLVLDSSGLEKPKKKTLLTGLVVEESSSDTGEASSSEESSPSSEASPSDTSESSDTSYSETEGGSEEESSPSQEPPSSETGEEPTGEIEPVEEPIEEPVEETTGSEPTPKPPVEEEPETNITEPIPEPVDNETVNETINETINETEVNVTEPVPEPSPEPKEVRIKFNDICVETCELDLNKDFYTLRIEVVDANLSLDKIKYEILGRIVPKNVTDVNVTVPQNVSPILIKSIPDLQIDRNGIREIKISDYFPNADEYYLLQAENISTTSYDHTVVIRPDENFIGTRQGKIIASNEFGITESNLFNIVVSGIVPEPADNVTIEILDNVTTFQYGAVIGQPVKWKKQIKLDKLEVVKVRLPKQAENIIVNKLEESEILYSSTEETLSEESSPSQNESPLLENVTKEETKIDKKEAKFSINALVISETGDEKVEERGGFFSRVAGFFRNAFRITGRAVTTEELAEELEVTIDDTGLEYEIEYETEAPFATEENTSKGKRIVVSGPDELNYTNILAFTDLPDVAPEIVKLYHIVNGSREEVLINQYDTNGDTLTDYIEWVVPHLSNQTYELEIVILNVKSHPQVGLNWTVSFNTTGMANLTITAYNGTNWSDSSEEDVYDLKFLELKCGEEILSYQWIDNGLGNSSVFIEDYECNFTAYETSKVLTEGFHTLEFDFGGTKAYAYNTAGNLNLKISGYINGYNSSVTLKTLSTASAQFDAFDLESSPPPSDYSEFISNVSVSGTDYILEVDAYNDTSNPRTIYLIYRLDATAGAQSGTIDFHWNDITGGNYTGNFTYYEDDSAYATPVESINMRVNNSYSNAISSEQYLYATVEIEEYQYPTINLTYPENITYPNFVTAINYTYNATDFESCWYSINDGTTNSSPVTCGTNWTDLNGSTTGANNITLYLNDSSGSFNSAIFHYTVDDVNPDVNFTDSAALNDRVQGDTGIFVNASLSDSNNVSGFIDFDSSLAGWWRMDDVNSSGDVIDYFGLYNGTVEGNAVQTDAGYLGKGFEFARGGSDCIDYGDIFDYPVEVNFTVAAWFKTYDTSARQIFVAKGYGSGSPRWWIELNSGTFQARVQDSGTSVGLTSGIAPASGEWHHVVMTVKQNENASLYVDGMKKDTDNVSLVGAMDGPNFNIGDIECGVGATYQVNGTMDDVMIFNRTLSLVEIRALYANQTSNYVFNNFTDLADGSHTFKAYAQDQAGNVNFTAMRSVTVDNVPPDVNFTDSCIANDTTQSNRDVFVNASLSDSNNVSGFIDFDSSLAGWWRMDDVNSSGDVIDYFGLYNGTAEGNAVQTDAGYLGKGFEFDGAGDYIDCGNDSSLNITNNLTISAWIKQVPANDGYVMMKNPAGDAYREYAMYVRGSADTIYFYYRSTVAEQDYESWGSIVVDDNTWHHLVLSVDYPSSELYVDGVSKGTRVLDGEMIGGNGTLWIGRRSADYYFNGTIDDVMLFNRSLSTDEILALYANQTSNYVFNNFTDLADGNYSFKAYAQDQAGNVNSTAIRFVTVQQDVTPPILTIEYPPNNSNFNDSQVMFNVSGNEILTYCGLSINGDANETMTIFNDTLFNYTNGSIANRVHNFLISCNDSNNNFGASSTYNFYIDVINPDVNFTDSAALNDLVQGNTDIFVNASLSDSVGNVSGFIDWDGSLVGWWRMDDVNSSGDVIDYFGLYNGSAEGNAVQTDAGYLGKGFEFDGAGDYVNMPDNENLDFGNTTNFSIGMWVKPANLGSQYDLALYKRAGADSRGYEIRWGASNQLEVLIDVGPTSFNVDTNLLTVGEWKHVFATFNRGGDLIVYDNGIEANKVDISSYYNWNISNSLSLRISNTGSDFNGTIDDVMIFNRTLSQDEIYSLYANQSSSYVFNNFTDLADGNYSFKAYAQDQAGNVNSTAMRFVTIQQDATPPTLTIEYPSNNSNFNISQVEFNVSGDENLTWCGLSINGDANATMTEDNETYFNYPNTSIGNGVHSFLISCNDSSNNFGASNIYNFYTDVINPDVNFTDSCIANDTLQSNTDVFVNASLSDSTGNVSGFIDFDDSLVSWWRMDDVNSSGDVIDYLGLNNGTAEGSAVQTDAGKLGKGFEFDGIDSHVEIVSNSAYQFDNFTDFSVSGWIKANDSARGFLTSTYSGGGADAFYIEKSGANVISVQLYSAGDDLTKAGTKNVADNEWHHFIITFNRTENLTIYVDGAFDVTANMSGVTNISNANNLNIGSLDGGLLYFNGTIDDFIIFNRSLTQDEIYALYANQSSNYVFNNFTDLADGNHTFKAYAQDQAGNVNSTAMRQVTIAIVDVVAPNISFVNPTPGDSTITSNTSVEINISITDENISEIRFNWNGTNYTMFDESLILMFNLDNSSALGESETVALDIAGYDNNATLSSPIVNLSGRYGGGYEFDGTETKAFSVADADNLNLTNFTISFWFRRKGDSCDGSCAFGGCYSDDVDVITAKGGGGGDGGAIDSNWIIGINFSSTLVFCGERDGGTDYFVGGLTAVNDDEWYHGVITNDGATVTVYLNGALENSAATGGTPDTNVVDVGVGVGLEGASSTVNGAFNGTIDEFRIWNKTLTADEIYHLYSSNLQKYGMQDWSLYVNRSKNSTDGLDPGNYTYYASVNDSAGNENLTETREIEILASFGITVETPSNDSWINPPAEFNVSGTQNMTWCGLSIDGNANETMTEDNATYYNYTNSSIADGLYTFIISCNDSNNVFKASSEYDFNIDSIYPLIDFVAPTPNNNTVTVNTSVEINISIVETNVSEILYNWNGTNYTMFNDSLVVGFNFDNNTNLGECDAWDCLVYDYSGYGNHGNLTNITDVGRDESGLPEWVSGGKYGGAFNFTTTNTASNGQSILIEHHSSLNPGTDDFAMAVWFVCHSALDTDISRKGSTTTHEGGGWYKMEIGGYGTPDLLSLQFNVASGTDAEMESTQDVCDGDWHFGLAQRRGDTAELYIDAVNQSTLVAGHNDVPVSGSISNLANLTIGSKDTQDDDFMNGTIDEYRLYMGRSFSQEEIEILYMSNLRKYDTDKWEFYINQTQNTSDVLGEGDYTYSASVKDLAGNENITATRLVKINAAPEIVNVTGESPAVTILEAPSSTSVSINFTVYDINGADTLDNSTAMVNLTFAGEDVRQNLSCVNVESSGYYANYSCTVEMFWWDVNDTWEINAYIEDLQGASGINTSETQELGDTTAFVASLGNITFPGIAPGAENKTSDNDPLLLNNTGNVEIPSAYLKVNSSHLRGESDSNYALWAGNFSVDWRTGGDCVGDACTECAGTQMVNYTFASISGANLSRGNYTVNDGDTGQEELYFCLRYVGTELTTQSYSTANEGYWYIDIALSIIIFAYSPNIRSKKKKRKKKKRLLQALELLSEELKEDYSVKKKELVNRLVKEVKKESKLTNKELFGIIKVKIEIPVTIFTKKLGALEAVVKYMKENLNLAYSEIANILSRNESTIWTAYNKANHKMKNAIKIDSKDLKIPASIFNRKLTILESTILYLKKKGLKYVEIASVLDRDQRNVWTIYSKAVKKNK